MGLAPPLRVGVLLDSGRGTSLSTPLCQGFEEYGIPYVSIRSDCSDFRPPGLVLSEEEA